MYIEYLFFFIQFWYIFIFNLLWWELSVTCWWISSFSYSFWEKKILKQFFAKCLSLWVAYESIQKISHFDTWKRGYKQGPNSEISNIGKIYTIYIFHLILKCLMRFFPVLNKFKEKTYQNWIKKKKKFYIPSK